MEPRSSAHIKNDKYTENHNLKNTKTVKNKHEKEKFEST